MINKQIAFKALSNFTEGLEDLSKHGIKSKVLHGASDLYNIQEAAVDYGISRAAKEMNVNKDVVRKSLNSLGGEEAVNKTRKAWIKTKVGSDVNEWDLDDYFNDAVHTPIVNQIGQHKNGTPIDSFKDLDLAANISKTRAGDVDPIRLSTGLEINTPKGMYMGYSDTLDILYNIKSNDYWGEVNTGAKERLKKINTITNEQAKEMDEALHIMNGRVGKDKKYMADVKDAIMEFKKDPEGVLNAVEQSMYDKAGF